MLDIPKKIIRALKKKIDSKTPAQESLGLYNDGGKVDFWN